MCLTEEPEDLNLWVAQGTFICLPSNCTVNTMYRRPRRGDGGFCSSEPTAFVFALSYSIDCTVGIRFVERDKVSAPQTLYVLSCHVLVLSSLQGQVHVDPFQTLTQRAPRIGMRGCEPGHEQCCNF